MRLYSMERILFTLGVDQEFFVGSKKERRTCKFE